MSLLQVHVISFSAIRHSSNRDRGRLNSLKDNFLEQSKIFLRASEAMPKHTRKHSYHDAIHSSDTCCLVMYLDSTLKASTFSLAVMVSAAHYIPRSIFACLFFDKILQSFLSSPLQNHFHILKTIKKLFQSFSILRGEEVERKDSIQMEEKKREDRNNGEMGLGNLLICSILKPLVLFTALCKPFGFVCQSILKLTISFTKWHFLDHILFTVAKWKSVSTLKLLLKPCQCDHQTKPPLSRAEKWQQIAENAYCVTTDCCCKTVRCFIWHMFSNCSALGWASLLVLLLRIRIYSQPQFLITPVYVSVTAFLSRMLSSQHSICFALDTGQVLICKARNALQKLSFPKQPKTAIL